MGVAGNNEAEYRGKLVMVAVSQQAGLLFPSMQFGLPFIIYPYKKAVNCKSGAPNLVFETLEIGLSSAYNNGPI